jgi:ABC-type dipeptide/oligopeptide/nickel transport system permease subunit
MTQPTSLQAVEKQELAAATAESTLGARIEGRTPLQLAWLRLRQDRIAMASLLIIVLLVALAVFAPLLVKLIGHPPDLQYRKEGFDANGLPASPGSTFWLGADGFGRDVLSRCMYGARISLFVGVLSSLCAIAIGIAVGLLAGYHGGRVDTVLSRGIDIILGFPFLLTAIALVSVFQSSILIVVAVIVFFTWSPVARVVRGQVLSIKEKEFVEAARSLGARDVRIMVVDILPNLVGPVIVYGTLLIPTAIVFEATLSYLGLGIRPPQASWGNMLADGQAYYGTSWWMLFFPALFLFTTTLAFNLFGDGLRDALDPNSARTLAKK